MSYYDASRWLALVHTKLGWHTMDIDECDFRREIFCFQDNGRREIRHR
jgi:hypothetical protein